MAESWSLGPRYKVQLIDRERSVIVIEAILIGRNVVLDLVRSSLERHDLAGSLEVTIYQLPNK